MLQSSLFSLILNKDLKVSSLEESGRIVAHENVQFPKEITKQGAQSLPIKMRDAELYLKRATVIYGLQQDCPNYRQSWKD